MVYIIKRDEDGRWHISTELNGVKTGSIYCNTTTDLMQMFLMLDSSGWCPPCDKEVA